MRKSDGSVTENRLVGRCNRFPAALRCEYAAAVLLSSAKLASENFAKIFRSGHLLYLEQVVHVGAKSCTRYVT